MREENIVRLKELIKDCRAKKYAEYKETSRELEVKYGTEMLNSVIKEDERQQLRMLKNEYEELCDLYDDFIKHKWETNEGGAVMEGNKKELIHQSHQEFAGETAEEQESRYSRSTGTL